MDNAAHDISSLRQIQGLKFEDHCVRYARYHIQVNYPSYGLIRSGWESHGRAITPASPLDFNKKRAKEVVHQLGLPSKNIGKMPDLTIVRWTNKRRTKFVIQSFIECKQGHLQWNEQGEMEHVVSMKDAQSKLLTSIRDIGFKVHILASVRDSDWIYTSEFDPDLLDEYQDLIDYRPFIMSSSQTFMKHLSLFTAMERIMVSK